MKKRVQADWSGWRTVSGVLSRVAAKVKGNIYKMVVRPALLYDLEMTALTKRQEAEM